MDKKLKVKDFVFLGIISALYTVLYVIVTMAISPLGGFGHAISPGIFAIVGGTVIVFISKKLGKMWQFTILTIINMALMSLMGGGYLPWFITTTGTAIIADLICRKDDYKNMKKVGIGYGLMSVGQAWGAIIPSWFFLEQYKATWISRGQTPEAMNEYIKYTEGIMGVWATLICFVLGIIGVYIGSKILSKHFNAEED